MPTSAESVARVNKRYTRVLVCAKNIDGFSNFYKVRISDLTAAIYECELSGKWHARTFERALATFERAASRDQR